MSVYVYGPGNFAGKLTTWKDRVVKSLQENPEFAHAMDPKPPNYSRAGAATLFLLKPTAKGLISRPCNWLPMNANCNTKFLGHFTEDRLQSESSGWIISIPGGRIIKKVIRSRWLAVKERCFVRSS